MSLREGKLTNKKSGQDLLMKFSLNSVLKIPCTVSLQLR